MCGIAGVMTADGSQPSSALLDGFLRALAHRGPDGEGAERGAEGTAGFLGFLLHERQVRGEILKKS